ncbi:hypothetical protein NN561_019724 [Cricetulus griseus]
MAQSTPRRSHQELARTTSCTCRSSSLSSASAAPSPGDALCAGSMGSRTLGAGDKRGGPEDSGVSGCCSLEKTNARGVGWGGVTHGVGTAPARGHRDRLGTFCHGRAAGTCDLGGA